MTGGRCIGGAVGIAADAPPRGTGVCHCSRCRRPSGPLGALAVVPGDALGGASPLTGLTLHEHIFIAGKGGYPAIADGVAQFD